MVTKAGRDRCKPLIKTPEEDEEEIQEAAASVAAVVNISVNMLFIKIGWHFRHGMVTKHGTEGLSEGKMSTFTPVEGNKHKQYVRY